MRLLLLRVWEESTLPPLILQPGDNVSQDVKCFSVGHRLRSVPHSAHRNRSYADSRHRPQTHCLNLLGHANLLSAECARRGIGTGQFPKRGRTRRHHSWVRNFPLGHVF